MKVLDPGHRYLLASLDGDDIQFLQFVKREGEGYPGNTGHYSGTTMQEVLRVLINRAQYVNQQIPCEETVWGIDAMRQAIREFETRAAKRHGRTLENVREDIENEPTCKKCGHIRCKGECHR